MKQPFRRITVALLVAMLVLTVFGATAAFADDGSDPDRWTPINPLPGFDKNIKLDPAQAEAFLSTLDLEPGEYGEGDERIFFYLDNYVGFYRLTRYTVAYIGDNVEIWVQNNLNYYNPDGTLNPIHPNADDAEKITPERIKYYADLFEDTVRPTLVDYYGPYADRDGSDAFLPVVYPIPPDYFVTDNPQRVVILVSNIRDNHFYEPFTSTSLIAGFVSSTLNFYGGRSFFTIDSQDWERRLGPPGYDWEGTLSHEFQHLIGSDSPGGTQPSWIEEGLSEYAEFIIGFRPSPEAWRTQFHDHPENALMIWGDQDSDEDEPAGILADYHQADLFLLYLAGRLQDDFLTTGPDGNIRAIASIQSLESAGKDAYNELLSSLGAPYDFDQVWYDFRAAMLHGDTSDTVDWGDYITEWNPPTGIPIAPLDLGRLRRNYNVEAYDTPGAGPYATDYLQIGWTDAISTSTELAFTGNPPTDTPGSPWSSVPADALIAAGVPTFDGLGDSALWSDHFDFNDHFMIVPVSVPAAGATLEFDTFYNIETEWDFGFVQVATDTENATVWTSLPIEGTTGDHITDVPQIVANLPGFTGVSEEGGEPAWLHKSYDLADYAGQDILLAFRYAADQATAGDTDDFPPAWIVDNIMVGDVEIYTDGPLPDAVQNIWDYRGYAVDYLLDVVTFEDANGANVTGYDSVPLDENLSATIMLGDYLSDAGFDSPGESLFVLVSALPPANVDDILGDPFAGAFFDYSLTGMPATILSTRTRMQGTALDSNIRNARSYPGDDYTVNVTVDNLGKTDNVVADMAHAYVAVELPDFSEYVEDSLSASVASENITFTMSLQSVDAGLPDVPGMYWHGEFTKTVDLLVSFNLDEPLDIGTIVGPAVHIANGPFDSDPSQHFTSLSGGPLAGERYEKYVTVRSPLQLSKALGPDEVAEGDVATFDYIFLNQDDASRNVDFSFMIPEGFALVGMRINNEQVIDPQAGMRLPIKLGVPSTLVTGLSTEISIDLQLPEVYDERTFNPDAWAYQPDSMLEWVDMSIGDVTVTHERDMVEVPLAYDTWMDFNDPFTNKNFFQALVAFANGQDRILLTFDKSMIPADAEIASAELHLYPNTESGAVGKEVTVLNVDPFDPMTVAYADGVLLNYYNPSESAGVTVMEPVVVDVTGNVMEWMMDDSMWGQLAVSLTGPFSGRVAFYSLESFGFEDMVPKLVVTYTY